MKVLVTGSAGQLAQAIRAHWQGHELILPPESALDLCKPMAIKEVLSDLKPDVVINAGAFTQVDLCEVEPAQAFCINAEAVHWMADVCNAIGALLVQISTDYVFDGSAIQPYREDDPLNPASVYGRSKAKGEEEARRALNHLVVRTAWLYDMHGRNFYNTMLGLAKSGHPIRVVNDQRGAPTTCRALARQLEALVDAGCRGTLHATCHGMATWYDFAAEIFRLHGLNVDLSPCSTHDYPRPAHRPAYSVLDGSRRAQLGVDVMPEWHDALQEVVDASTDLLPSIAPDQV